MLVTVTGAGNPLVGPVPTGILGMSAWVVAAVIIFASRTGLQGEDRLGPVLVEG
jgi:hypothetical protein